MGKRRKSPTFVRWLLGFRLVRLALGFACGGLILGIVVGVLVAYVAGPTHVIVERILFLYLYVPLAALGIFLWVRHERRRRFRLGSLGQLLHLSPTQFEEAVGDLLHDLGYRDVRRVGGAGDLAADLTCRDERGRSVVIQCKRYGPGKHVGSPTVQSFIGMVTVHHHADRGIIVTTSGFTRPAAALARQHDITLVDGIELARLIGTLHHGDHAGRTGDEQPLHTPQM